MTDLLELPIATLAQKVRRGEVSAAEVAEATIAAILRDDDRLGAYLTRSFDELRARAIQLDLRRAQGEQLGPLAGVPIGVKDAFATKGVATTCASRILVGPGGRPWIPPYDAAAVTRLLAADAMIAGKCNMDEFAMGSSTENSAFFPARNPWDDSRTPGGSSGGSAVSVAAGMTPGALGSDTGGSVRQPAAFTGVVGVKPTYGRVSRYGLVAFASSLDVVSPFARDVRSAALLTEAIAGHDPRDSTSADRPVGTYVAACERPLAGLRVGVPSQYFAAGIDPDVEASVRGALDQLASRGATLVPVSLPHTEHAVAVYYVLAAAEASSNLSRFDGVRFGARVASGGLDELYERTRGQGFGAEVKRRVVLGAYVLSHGYYDAYYLQAQRVRTLIARDFDAAFVDVDVIAAPTTPTPAFKLGDKIDDPLTMYLSDVYTLPASLAGLPAMSVPVAPTPATDARPSLPVGLQLIAPAFDEEALFRAGAAVERIVSG
ncbi:MAG: Asp-tRNA(Asn)/Glu-tRNA(Gln) amidotransferase subunit GatA [Polyangiaceae bacterium]|nr:Asp-tRNA(Asn)/Glu-tRNA(Gln) amidotransferase subunit GatA [Polyangiaceae bacterium]